jgi:putative hydrolase of the HAD superfamily
LESIGRLFSEDEHMDGIRGIGFDLFNTLITVEPWALSEAVGRLCSSLQDDGIAVEREIFHKAHRQAALQHIAETHRDGRETHNRFWISTALCRLGFALEPDDPRISRSVERYFSAFQDHCRLIPGTKEMLGAIKDRYRLGLLSNFTHPPAARAILEGLGIASFFEVTVISGEIGYRKPHALVFDLLLNRLGLSAQELLYVGDDPEPDIEGACSAGIRTVWTTYVRDRNIPLAPGVAQEQLPTPNCPTLRISSWEELLMLLDGNGDFRDL